VAVPYLARLVASLGSVRTTPKLAPYMDLLDRVLEDDQVTEAEAGALRTTAEHWGLSMEAVLAAHHAYLESLVASAVEDGRVTGTEHRELRAVAHLLAIDSSVLDALLVRGMEDRG
jgi:hypothetical protein